MPAVDLARLRFQIEALTKRFDSPPAFHRALQDLFSLYSHHALQRASESKMRPLLPAYKVPHPILRQLKQDLTPFCIRQPAEALALADELWQGTHLEIKQVAILLLGHTPVEPDLIIQRLALWLTPHLDKRLLDDIFAIGTRQLQIQSPTAWEHFIESYLSEGDLSRSILGIRGLTEGVKNPNFKNLPAVFRLISPIVRQPDRQVLRELARLIEVLSKQHAIETGFFLNQTLTLPHTPETERLVKQCLNAFPQDIQDNLKAMLRR